MNDYPDSAAAGNAADIAGIRAFLQQAADHYPRLAALSFKLVLAHHDTVADYRANMHTPKSGGGWAIIRGNASRRVSIPPGAVTLDMGGDPSNGMQNGDDAQYRYAVYRTKLAVDWCCATDA
ncbi:hypothetical protein [Enterobacter asburiae]|uniref:hypothetical protein n=1 Tax=Enterobacter asburiae TaxID=61645 RepID=UPI003F55CF7E